MSKYPCATFVRIIGDPYRTRAEAYKEALAAAEDAWRAFAAAKGATHYSGHRELSSLTFPRGKVAPGWSMPSTKGRSHPLPTKLGKVEAAEVAALPEKPSPWDVFPEVELPFQLNYKGPGRGDHGGGTFANIFEPSVLWFGGGFYGLVADVAAGARAHLIARPGSTIEGPGVDWVLPDGLERMTEAEWNFATARFALEEERKPDGDPLTLEDAASSPAKFAAFAGRRVLIRSDNGYWRAGGCGYAERLHAGTYVFEDAFARTRHCGPEKSVTFERLRESP